MSVNHPFDEIILPGQPGDDFKCSSGNLIIWSQWNNNVNDVVNMCINNTYTSISLKTKEHVMQGLYTAYSYYLNQYDL